MRVVLRDGDEKEQKKSKEERARETVRRQHDEHKGLWLTAAVCEEFQKRVKYYCGNDGNDIGVRRALRKELQETYGLLEIEAINILNGYNVNDYLRKYYMIENQLTVYDLRKDDEDSEQIKGIHL